MGLDMYLSRIEREAVPFIEHDPDDIKTSDPALYAEMKPYLNKCGDPQFFQWESLFEEVGYWRKANQIHKWFVENVQEGEDDCGQYEVSFDQLRELRELCIKVATESVMTYGKINNGYTFDGTGAMKPIIRPGMTIINPEIAEELLPSQGGFFFGSTDYDEYYLDEVKNTIEIVNRVLKNTDPSEHAIYYSSSW